jgi:hypothetical protein
MRPFLKYTFTVIVITGIASSVIFYSINTGLRKQKVDIYGKMNELVSGHENFDIVFIGSSRVNLTVNPAVIDSVTHLSSFNFGFDGANIIDFTMHVQVYLKNHVKPQLLVLNIDPKMFGVEDKIKVPPSKYLPYVYCDEIYDTLKNYSNWPFVSRYMPFVATSFYTDAIVNQALQAYISPDRKMENYYKGFSPLTRIWSKGDQSAKDLVPVFYTNKGLALFRSFLKTIHDRNIHFKLIYSPQYFFSQYDAEHKAYIQKLNAIASEFNYSITDYSTMKICSDKKYFFDATHLNLDGANLFSRQLGLDLDEFIIRK